MDYNAIDIENDSDCHSDYDDDYYDCDDDYCDYDYDYYDYCDYDGDYYCDCAPFEDDAYEILHL